MMMIHKHIRSECRIKTISQDSKTQRVKQNDYIVLEMRYRLSTKSYFVYVHCNTVHMGLLKFAEQCPSITKLNL